MSAFRYAEAKPPADLADAVLSFWSFAVADDAPDHCEHTVWPDGCPSIAVVLPPGAQPIVVRVNATTVATRRTVARGMRFWGIRFWPDRVSLASDASIVGLAEAVGSAASTAESWAALAEWARTALAGRPVPDTAVRSAVRHIVTSGGTARIEDVATACGLGVRQLQRRFRSAAGMTPKAYARVRRLRSTLAARLAAPDSWSMTAATTGFSDQAHLVREFAELTGLTPRAADARLREIVHSDVEP